MKKIIISLIILIFIGTKFSNVFGYGNENTHPAINKVIVSEFKNRLGIYKTNYPEFKKFEKYFVSFDISTYSGLDVTKGGWYLITNENRLHTAAEWIERGGFTADEPEIAASLRHFYDPVMNDGYLFLTDAGGNPSFNNPWIDAVFWAFDGADPRGNNTWTWNQGKSYMALAIQNSDKLKKEQYTAQAMRCLGEVLHNTADMGLPAHVRNDAHGGWGPIGGRIDPYESITTSRPDWAATYGVNSCSPDLATYFRASTSAKNINMYLAKFTNKNFFSNETISGEGVKSFSSINGFKDYSSPKLENFTYNPETFGYYKTFTSGREVKMCVDQSLFMGYVSGNFRSQPRVDISCVESQAKELFPDIVEAGINVVRNFIPNLQINLTVNSKTGQVSGDIIHTTDAEYPNSIGYGGDVNFWINGKLSTTAFTASNGKFAGTLSGLKNGDKVIAKIEFADITVSSEELKVNMNALTILNMGDFTVRAELVWNTKWAGYDRDQFSDWKFTSANASISATNVSIGKTTYCQPHSVEIFTVTFNPSTQKVESFHIKATIMSSDGMNKDVYDISLKGTASNAVWYTSGGCDLMNLGYTDMLSKVNYSEIRYKLTPINDGSGTSEWIVSSTIDATGLKSSDGMGHATGIRFYSTTTK